MPAADFAHNLFGFRVKGGRVTTEPNILDKGSETSLRIATAMLETLGVTGPAPAVNAGPLLEAAVCGHLSAELPRLDPRRDWVVSMKEPVSAFTQYQHLEQLQALAKSNPTLSVELPQDYVIKPDVTVGLAGDLGDVLMLHASVSCKWTLRSDRAQNVRHEAVILMRTRRDRLPHVVAVTAEPMFTRLAALARGTGEIDAVYHIALDELVEATKAVGTNEQRDAMDEMVGQNRIRDFSLLARHLATA